LTIKVDKGPLSFWKLLERGKWDVDLIEFIVDFVKPGETILDVGAWIGPLALLFSHLVGKAGSVHAFEPMPQSFSLLEHYVADNNIHNLHLYNVAIANAIGSVTLHSNSPNSPMATMINLENLASVRKSSEYNVRVKCACTTIDGFCRGYGIQPTGIKIDVEGAEQYVLDGAVKTIANYHPWCLLELHGHLISQSQRQRIWSFITDRAKRLIYILGNEIELAFGMEVPPGFQPSGVRAIYGIFFE
jgi:FkbM family methyltransferase